MFDTILSIILAILIGFSLQFILISQGILENPYTVSDSAASMKVAIKAIDSSNDNLRDVIIGFITAFSIFGAIIVIIFFGSLRRTERAMYGTEGKMIRVSEIIYDQQCVSVVTDNIKKGVKGVR